MQAVADKIKRKRQLFTLWFVVLTAIYGGIEWYLSNHQVAEKTIEYIVLAWRLALAALSMWFGYSVGFPKQTTWFMSLLAILPPPFSWLGVLYLLYKSGRMQMEEQKQSSVAAGNSVEKRSIPTDRPKAKVKKNKPKH